MDGIRVGKRVVGTQAPVIIGWENIARVEGGRFKVAFFTYFQPALLFALVAFWYYAPNSIATGTTAAIMGLVLMLFFMVLEWRFPRHESWAITWKEFATDAFFVAIGFTFLGVVDDYIGSDKIIETVQANFHLEKLAWFTTLPVLLQAFLISFIFDFVQYWMHRGMHNWYPLWLPHSVHHYITQLNVNKGAVGNPVELFLIGLGIGGFFDFVPRAFLLASAMGMAIGAYQHINVRFNSPNWWRFLFNTTEHHSLHHSQDYESTRSNYAGAWIIIDRMFGTCIDGEAELLGMEGGRRMSIREQMTFPFTEGWKSIKQRFARQPAAVPAE
ncbi:MAG: sterol desaturase family protein [Candidatus Andeanibacterium colombiense]|uniref:Sterol desaturase family protein n=1 Tax=Candidatus Andeanibacterium colombiense TaxID=3121345 RepID=A0AAJ5X8T6_9SPHN|nr:MAG: sterol desaturase family protein [Sphingomonadaceae bacterium]